MKKEEKKYEYKFIIYEDDDGTIKYKSAYICKDISGVEIKFSKDSSSFWIPNDKIKKIKEVRE